MKEKVEENKEVRRKDKDLIGKGRIRRNGGGKGEMKRKGGDEEESKEEQHGGQRET